ncbi:MAG: HAD hydrolase-like protein [Gammaproteobacteria bacterium]|jgi:phosphoglycolate phosphatase|nr:HAD hydrolase-like protein [Gammaproteobacteria bacterium]MDH3860396.1 HAD hydrolase-like protein [Gammaproteobacteria bacterium]
MTTHVYFDLDGTLTDPYEGITNCILYALDELGFPRPDDDYLYSCIGPPLWDTFPELVGQDLTRKAVDLYRERFLDTGWKENKPYDGIVDALETVASAGHLMFVATAKPHMHAARIIEHFGMGEFFATVYGSELDGTRGTKTELLEFAIGRNPGGTRHIMVGDRKHDLIGAVANAMTPVGVAYGYGSVEELTAAGATAIAVSPADLPGILT